uniref:Uncharacterized protein n=1 Tax=Cucumis melo TaxID=3656 RepID=A0A9I9ED13_CUCME
MKKVGANSDIHWVLFDEENRAVGFHANSRGLWESHLHVFRPHYDKDDESAGRTPLHRRACKRCCIGCTLHNVKKSVVRRLHAIFRSKLAGSPEGGVTCLAKMNSKRVFPARFLTMSSREVPKDERDGRLEEVLCHSDINSLAFDGVLLHQWCFYQREATQSRSIE